MPELPEVETFVRILRPRLVGRRVRSAVVRWGPSTGGRSLAGIVGRSISSVERRAKYILIELHRGVRPAGWLVGHLRMTGRMYVGPAGTDPGPHARVTLGLDRGEALHFVDVRKFGRLVPCRGPEEALPALGPEPLGEEFTESWLRSALRRRRRKVKPLLLDQSFVAGLGNIYVDESLHESRIHPERIASGLDRDAVGRLHAAVRSTLEAAIEREGSSFDRYYRTPEGRPGGYQERFRVYGRKGRPCPACGAVVRRIVVAQRGTHVCLRCQRPPRRRRVM
jgi:formamidopyrimidine-DNA glycosylase